MVKEGVLERDGEVLEKLPAGILKVRLKGVGTEIRCKLSGKMKQRHISVIAGDWVKVEVNQYDMTQGRITYRYNNYQVQEEVVEEKKAAVDSPDKSEIQKKKTIKLNNDVKKAA